MSSGVQHQHRRSPSWMVLLRPHTHTHPPSHTTEVWNPAHLVRLDRFQQSLPPSLTVTKTWGGDVMMMKSMALVVAALVGQAFADYQFDDSWTRIG